MDSALHTRLKELDHLGWEYPEDPNFGVALDEIFSHQAAIENILGCSLTTFGPQDASFATDFYVQDQSFANIEAGGMVFTQLVQVVCVRFSTFDRMFTVFGTELERFEKQLPILISYLQSHGFKYVSHDDLMEPYDGSCIGGDRPLGTWFGRFFDHL